MKSAAVFTLQGPGNYGNRLQNYAVERILRDRFDRVVSFVPTNHVILKPLQLQGKEMLNYGLGDKRRKTEAKRKALFFRFDRRYLHLKYTNLRKLSGLNKEFDCFVTGSDQVWNPSFDPLGIFLLPFAKNRVCISPSIGVDHMEPEYERRLQKELPKFKNLCAREESGKRILERITGRNVDRLIDPTMYIDAAEWEKLENKPKNFDQEKYIFCYNLGSHEIEKSKIAHSLKEKYNCDICSIYDERHENKIIAGPEEFIWLIHHSSFVLTDSFHAAVFSLLFHRDFIICHRGGSDLDMNTRFETLYSVFHIDAEPYVEARPYEIKSIDFNEVDRLLLHERLKMKNYLDKSFKTLG